MARSSQHFGQLRLTRALSRRNFKSASGLRLLGGRQSACRIRSKELFPELMLGYSGNSRSAAVALPFPNLENLDWCSLGLHDICINVDEIGRSA